MTAISVHGSTPVSREAFIAGMRDVSSSVTIVTTDGPAGRHGATVSAFCSVSADPPSVLICLNAESRVAHAVVENASFCVNIVPEGGLAVANRFAGADDREIADRFEGIALETGVAGQPVLRGSTAFSCAVASVVQKGTHYVILGDVEAVRVSGGPPQTYWAGDYRMIARETPSLPSQGEKRCQ